MQQIADLHIHSRYSRACSPQLTIPNIEKTCRVKGIDIVGTGDFTYPNWFDDIKNNLEEYNPSDNSSLYRLKTATDDKIKFILTTELALVYKKNGKCRRIHILVQAPNLKAVEELNSYLDKDFNIRSDGRPILGMSTENLMELCLGIHPKFLIYPAHIWTPWFAVFGSKSGFDSMEECFGEFTDKVYAYETGLSSDPEMNWRLSALDKLTLLSNSDAHSLVNLGREANVLDLNDVSYDEIYEAIKNKDLKKLKYSIEFYPEEGMYHLDGHRVCNIRQMPDETRKSEGICPICKKPLTLGVDYRVSELADRPVGAKPAGRQGFKKLVELDKIIAEALNIRSRSSKKVIVEYENLIKQVGPELFILIDASLEDIEKASNKNIAEALRRVREGELIVEPGYDGEYGVVKIFSDKERKIK